MHIRIDKGSDVTISRQLSEQIVFQIATGKVKLGDPLPSVRELALRLKVSPTTVSEAYQNLVERLWIKRNRGKKMVVRAPDRPLESGPAADLDDLIDATIHKARERGYTLQELRKRVQDRLLIEHPDHVLIVEEEPGMRRILQEELSEKLPVAIASTSLDALSENASPVIGALVVFIPGRVWRIASQLPRGHPMLALEPSSIEDHLNRIRNLKTASVIGIVSISPLFLEMAKTLLAPFVGSVHAIEEHLLEENRIISLSGLDLVFCDTVSRRRIRASKVIPHSVTSGPSILEISSRLDSSAR